MRTVAVGAAGVGATLALSGILAALGAAGSIPLAILATWAIVGVVGRRASARRVTWSRAIREGSADERRLAALRRLAGREGRR